MKHTIKLTSTSISKAKTDNILNWLRNYATKRINSRLMDERRCIPPYIMMDLGNKGILGMQIEEKYGGLALTYQDTIRILEQLAAIDLSLATIIFLNNSNGIRPIQFYAKESIREHFLPLLATGRQLASFGLTEPLAGANIAGIKSEGIPQPEGGWKINGFKRWNASAWSSVISVFVRLKDDNNKLGGITGFVIPQDSQGVTIGEEVLTMGVRSIIQNGIYFDDVSVTDDQILGDLGKGIDIIDDTFIVGRLFTAVVALGTMKRCSQLMLRYATRREVSTGLLLNNPLTISILSDLTIKISVIDILIKFCAEILDNESTLPMEVSMTAKVVASESCTQCANDLMQLLGGRGYMENNIAPQILRDAKLLTVGEGPNESLILYIGRSASYSDNLDQFLRHQWQQDILANTLQDTITTIKNHYSKSNLFNNHIPTLNTYTYFMVGKVTIALILYSCVNYAYSLQPSTELERVLNWGQINFNDTVNFALNQTTKQSFLFPNQITEIINSYQNSIADIEQTLAGIEENIDPLLAKNFQPTNNIKSKLPGNIDLSKINLNQVQINNLSAEEKRQLLSKLLKNT